MDIINLILSILSILLISFFLGGFIFAVYSDRKKWNHGICYKCHNGVWKSTMCDSGGCSHYKCTKCGESWWENGYGKKIELDSNNPNIIRSYKIRNIIIITRYKLRICCTIQLHVQTLSEQIDLYEVKF